MSNYSTKEEIAKVIAEIDHEKVRGYLITKGWFHSADLRNIATIWHRPTAENINAEVVLPSATNLKDYTYSLFAALVAIAEYEGTTPKNVSTTIAAFNVDRVSVRVIHPDVTGGTIPLNDGVMLNQHAKEMMAAAALSAISKRRHFSGARPPETRAFLDTLRLGQTSVGSYIVNVLAPLAASDDSNGSIQTTSLSRIVTENLSTSLHALENASQRYLDNDDLSVFDPIIEQGVSANLCDALLGFSGENRAREFEIEITPGLIEKDTAKVSKLTFTKSKIWSIGKAAEYYKADYVLQNQTIVGFVKRLDRPRADENGTITVEAKVSGAEKFIVIELTAEDYMEAVNAHKTKDPISCNGDIHVQQRKVRLLNLKDFKVLRSKDLNL